MICARFKSIAALALLSFTLFTIPFDVECANKKGSASAPAVHEPTIEEVTAKQLERILADKDYVAVYWCKFGRILIELLCRHETYGLRCKKVPSASEIVGECQLRSEKISKGELKISSEKFSHPNLT